MGEALSGSCQCGAVRYKALQSVKFRGYACHCTCCQSQTGSDFALQLWLMATDITVEGALITGKFVKPDGNTVTMFACPNCFSRIYGVNSARPQFLVLRAGTLDDSARFKPHFHLWTRSKQLWVSIPEGAVVLETQAGSPEEWLQLLTGKNGDS
jgi:hypothetical protein